MNCDELIPNYLLYAMGKLEGPELLEIRAHLARGCDDCTAGVRAAQAYAYSMGAILEGQEPSAALRARVLSIPDTGSELPGRPSLVRQRRPFWVRRMPVWLGSALAAACVVLALIPGLAWRNQLSTSQAAQSAAAAQLAREQRDVASLREQIGKLKQPGQDRGVARSQGLPIFALELVRGSAAQGEASQKLTIPRGTAAIVVALPVDLVRGASAAQLRNASDQEIWNASPLAGGNSESVGVTIPGELLPAGRYVIVLLAGQRTIARLPFDVALEK